MVRPEYDGDGLAQSPRAHWEQLAALKGVCFSSVNEQQWCLSPSLPVYLCILPPSMSWSLFHNN